MQGTQITGDVRRKSREWDKTVVARMHHDNQLKTCMSDQSDRNVWYRKASTYKVPVSLMIRPSYWPQRLGE